MKRILSLLFSFLCIITISAQNSKNVYVEFAGTLNAQISPAEKLNITNLSITGNIDVRDIKFIRDDMSNLSYLDMSAASIRSYNGLGGTYPWGAFSYLNNEIPTYSFSDGSTGKSSLKSILLPNSTSAIGNNAFYNCDGLTDIDIPNSVQSIGYSAFQMCDALTNVTIGTGVTSLGDQSFYDCKKLRIVSVKATSPPTYGGYAFRYTNLSLVFVPSSSLALYKADTNWGKLPLSTNEVITVHNTTAGGIVSSLNSLGYTSLSSISKLIVTGNINSADFVQFKAMPLLLELDLSGAVLENNAVPMSALQNKTILSKLLLPATVTSIGDNAFSNCLSLKEIFPLPSSLVSIGDFAFWKCSALTDALVLPTTLTTIGSSAFKSCSGITGSLTIPNSVISIGNYAFDGCAGLTGELTLSSNLAKISNATFAGCTNLSGVLVIPNLVSIIEPSAFYDCKKITELVIGTGCSSIGDEAFLNAFALAKITSYKVIPPTLTVSTFGGVNTSTCAVEVPFGSLSSYQTANYWKLFTNLTQKSSILNIQIKVGSGGVVKENSIILLNNSVITANSGTTKTFSFEPEVGFEIETLTYGGVNVKSQVINNQFTTPSINNDAILNITFKKFYSINVQVGLGGVLKLNNALITNNLDIKVYSGDIKTFTIIPDEGYDFDILTYDGVDMRLQVVNDHLTIPAVTQNGALIVVFKSTILSYNITLNKGIGGDIIHSNDTLNNGAVISVGRNGVRTFKITPNENYVLETITYDGNDVKLQVANSQFITPLVTKDALLNITFKKEDSYDITIRVGTGGKITENNISLVDNQIVKVLKNDIKTFTLTPDPGYEIATLTYGNADVKSQVSNNQFVTQAVTVNATLIVTFQKTKYILKLKDAGSGTIDLICEYGATPVFGFTPATDWQVNKIFYNGVDVTSSLVHGFYTVPSITMDAILNVSFVNVTSAPQLINIIDNVNVYTSQSDIIVEGTSENEIVSVYTVNGAIIQTRKSQGERLTISVRPNTVYLVKTANKTFKVIL